MSPSLPSPAKAGSVPGLDDVPLAYGDPRAELEALDVAGLADLGVHTVVEVRGDDVVGFLQDVVAGPLGGAEPGDAVPTLLLDTDGKVQAVAHAWIRAADAADLLVQAPHGEAAHEALDGYARFADVTLDRADPTVLGLAGDAAGDLLEAHLDRPETGEVLDVEGGAVAGHGLGTGPAYTLRVDPDADLAGRLVEAARDRGGGPAGWRALEARRVRAGVPRAGAEATPDRFPQEAGLMAGVDLEKGCFVGQETVARIANRGQVNWTVVQVKGADAPRPGQPLKSAGEVGEVTSASPLTRPPQALAVVRREVAEEGSRLASPAGPVDVVGEADWNPEARTDR